MTRKVSLVLLVTSVLIIFSATLAADVVELKSGRIIEGEIIEETDELIAIETDVGTGFFSKEDIRSINKTRLDMARGRIVEITGTVEVLPKGETEWRAAEEGMSLNEGDSVRSGPDSKAIGVFADQLIMAVEQDSEVNLEKLEKSRRRGINIAVNLDNGQIWNDVGRLGTKRSKFYVKTPQAVTGVRGTVFTVRIAPDATTKVAVVRGTVEVRTRGLIMTPTKVKENTMTEVAENKPPAAPTTISEDFLAQWNEYKGKFRMLRIKMLGSRLQLTPVMIIVFAAIVVVILLVFRRKRLRRA
ncbi:MAG: FecR domain-containing protein [Candidatus Hydrogenedentota bacterium]|nr:MAG: FecR domain-containing protein [Candidatus Hydrogenedentota bacterium]